MFHAPISERTAWFFLLVRLRTRVDFAPPQRLFDVATIADGVWATVLYMSYATVQKHIAFGEML